MSDDEHPLVGAAFLGGLIFTGLVSNGIMAPKTAAQLFLGSAVCTGIGYALRDTSSQMTMGDLSAQIDTGFYEADVAQRDRLAIILSAVSR